MTLNEELVSVFQEWVHIFMHSSMRGFILYAKESGLSMSQIGALFRLNHKGACGVSDIGEDLGVSSAAASQMIDKLVGQELITRTEDPNDRRLKQIILTEKGRQLIHESIRARQGWMNSITSLMTPEEKEQVIKSLQIMIEKSTLLEKNLNCNEEFKAK